MRRFLLLILLLASPSLYSQSSSADTLPQFYYGLFAGVKYNLHGASFDQLPGVPSCCAEFTGDNSLGFGAGALLGMPLNEKFSLFGRIGYSMHGTLMNETEIAGNTEIRDANGNTQSITDALAEHEIDASLNLISFEPYVTYNVIDRLRVKAGLRLGYLISPTVDHSETLVSPRGVVYRDTQQKKRNVSEGIDLPDANSIQLHGLIGAEYEIPIEKGISIVPELAFYPCFTDLSSVDWGFSDLHAGAALIFSSYKDTRPTIRERQIIRDTIVSITRDVTSPTIRLIDSTVVKDIHETDEAIIRHELVTMQYEKLIPKTDILTLDLLAYGVNSDGTRTKNPKIIIEETEVSEMFPMLPYVFFEQNRYDLPPSGLKLISPQNAESFSTESLPWNTIGIYQNLLNIVGYRLKENPSAKLTITGTNNNTGQEANNLELSKNRAVAVSKYFEDVWGIDPSRINTISRNLPANFANNEKMEGLEENRRVELHSDDLDILAPVVLSDIEKSSNPPVVEIVPEAKSDAGIKDWQINITQGGENLRDYKGSGDPQPISWEIASGKMPKTEMPIEINMSAMDSVQNTVTADAELNLEQLTIREKRYELKDDRRIERFALIVFDYDKAEITPEHEAILEYIRSRIEQQSKVTIAGYTDKTGNPEYNKQLAAKRISQVQKRLNVKAENLTINNVGSDEILYDNSTPYGRNFSRTVKVIIETPVNE